MEIALFHRKPKKLISSTTKALKNLTQTILAGQFLAEPKRADLLQKMRMKSGLEAPRYESLCSNLIENLVSYCQNLPETTNSYYSNMGGLIDHALNRTEAALDLFQTFILQDSKSFSEPQKLWQYALHSAALLQNIGCLFMDYRINLFDNAGQFIKTWNPFEGSLSKFAPQYDYELQVEGEKSFRHRLNILLAQALMPKEGFSWLSSNPEVLRVWLALLTDDYQAAGTLAALLIRADAIALQRYFSDWMAKTCVKRGRYALGGPFIDAPETLLEKEQLLGLEFLEWLSKSLEEAKLVLNKGPLIMVPGGLLMTQELFQLFLDQSKMANWQAVQKGFLSLGLYTLDGSGRAILRFEQQGTNEMVSGVVLSKYAMVLPQTQALDLINKIQQTGTYTQKNQVNVQPLQVLNAQGLWQAPVEENSARPGAKSGV